MKFYSLTAIPFLFAMSCTALAAGTHDGGHDKIAVGEAGDKKKITRVQLVSMKDTEDGKMSFSPKEIRVKKGDTIKFKITNVGTVDHEFVLDDETKMMEHKAEMAKFPEMEHDDPNAIRLEPGKSGEIIWKFSNTGSFKFGCLIPGHMEAGMHGPVTVK